MKGTPLGKQTELREAMLDELAIEGGKLLGEDDITFEGTRFVIPEIVNDLDEAIGFLTERRDDEERTTRYDRTFPYRPMDGARATAKAITKGAGFTLGKTIHHWFGSNPPELKTITTGPNGETEQVPWGAMMIPGLNNTTVYLTEAQDATLGPVFRIVVEGPRKYRHHIKGLFKRIGEYLESDSLYRGKAMDGEMNFIDVYRINRDDYVYAERVQRRLQCEVWDRIRYADQFALLGQSPKRAYLLEGPYGSGKSAAADLTAQVALEHEWTFLFCRPTDDIATVLQMGRMYQPCVIFREDVDSIARAGAANIERTLDLMDGIDNKGLRMLVIMTTNHAEEIHKGMIRPGRLHGIIRIEGLDDQAIEKLTRRVVGEGLEGNIDWARVCESMHGYMPAFVREALDRAVGYSVSSHNGRLGLIGTDELVFAADSLREQYQMMEDASEGAAPDCVGEAFREVVVGAVHDIVHGTHIIDSDGDYRMELAVQNGG
jgi:ATPase family associated with various cellular activities (AAA)